MEEEDRIDMCCICCKDVKKEDRCFMRFRYQVPGTDGEFLLVACICPECAVEAEDPKLFVGLEAILNANIIRMRHPEITWTPK